MAILAAGATLADVDRNGVTVAERINSHVLRDALAAGSAELSEQGSDV